jgi:hypothetical protein
MGWGPLVSLKAPGDFEEMNLSETHLKDYMFVIFGTGLPRDCTLRQRRNWSEGCEDLDR